MRRFQSHDPYSELLRVCPAARGTRRKGGEAAAETLAVIGFGIVVWNTAADRERGLDAGCERCKVRNQFWSVTGKDGGWPEPQRPRPGNQPSSNVSVR